MFTSLQEAPFYPGEIWYGLASLHGVSVGQFCQSVASVNVLTASLGVTPGNPSESLSLHKASQSGTDSPGMQDEY